MRYFFLEKNQLQLQFIIYKDNSFNFIINFFTVIKIYFSEMKFKKSILQQTEIQNDFELSMFFDRKRR